MTNVLVTESEVLAVEKEVGTAGAEDVSTEATMVPATDKGDEILGAVLAFGLIFVLDPGLLGANLGAKLFPALLFDHGSGRNQEWSGKMF